MPKGVMVVQSRPIEGREDEFNAWYRVHVSELLETPGFVGARRFKAADGDHYLAIYELEADSLTAPVEAWRARSAAGQATKSDSMQTDPPPVVTLYELVE